MPRKLTASNPKGKAVFFTTIRKNFGNAHHLRTWQYAKNFKIKVVWAFHDESRATVKEISLVKHQITPIKEIALNRLLGEIEKINPSLIVFDLRELLGEFFMKMLRTTSCPSVIFDSRENEVMAKVNYVINPLPLLDEFPSNLYGLEYLKIASVTGKKRLQKNILFYLGSLHHPQYLRDSFRSVAKVIASSPELSEKPLIIILENPLLPFLEVFAKTYLKGIPVTFKKRLPSFNHLLNLHPLLFISHYGVSLLEAMQNEITTLVLAPTKYHLKLSRAYFPKLLYSEKITYKEMVKNNQEYFKNKQLGTKEKLIAPILRKLAEKKKMLSCPICHARKIKIVHRESWMNINQCSKCLLFFQEDFELKEMLNLKFPNYQKNYFLREYEKQYGKTYLADEENINRLNRPRLEIIAKLAPKSNSRNNLLDIGCAFGFFLNLAQEKGFETFGSEISPYAAKQAAKQAVKQIKQHSIITGDFLNFKSTGTNTTTGTKRFSVITLWFVLEHFPSVKEVLAKISQLQEKNGVLAFSTPNGRGLSARFQRKLFLKNSPIDHHYIFSFKNLKRLLKDHGYKIVVKKATGIHFDRFKQIFPALAFIIRKPIYKRLALFLNWGDTCEIYAKKIK